MEDKESQSALFWGFIINFVFFLIELVGAFLSNSMAVLSDALHDFADVISLFFSWWAEKSFHGRVGEKLKVAVALANALALGVGAMFLIYEAFFRLLDPEPIISSYVIVLAIFGILFNSFIFLRLRKGKHKNLNIKVLILHYLEDILGWVTILAGAIIMFFTDLFWIDGFITMVYSSIILILASRFLSQCWFSLRNLSKKEKKI
ncbi:cation diffusion facilitator family transporter [Nanoarchaeota archaeon]